MSSPQFISAEAMQAYCNLFGVNHEEDIVLLVKFITILDSLWLEDWSKKEKAKTKSSSKPPGRRF